tara:strand:- start:38434 stop:38832 length:399 start_codon:yes stop_codon:yes gene_type:complete
VHPTLYRRKHKPGQCALARFAALALLILILILMSLPGHAQVPPDAVWIDVRSHSEYASGHLETASNIPFDGIEAGVAALKLDSDQPIYLYCAVGGRAEVARKRLVEQGYTSVVNVGGLQDARKLAGDSAGNP